MARHRNGKNSSVQSHDMEKRPPTADQLRSRFQKIFYALSHKMQDAFVRLMEDGVRNLRR